MMTSLWLMSLVAVLALDMRTGAIQQKELVTHRCYSCSLNETCETPASVECPADRPLCAMTVVTPNFTSFLGCVTAAAVSKTPCSVTKTSAEVFELTCVCTEDLCNAPFSTEIQKQLHNFTSSNFTNNSTDYTDAFLKFANLTENDYKTMIVVVVMKNADISKSTISASTVKATIAHPVEIHIPRSEALKRDATAPSDDDEDETEGSGSYEDTRILRQPAADPANPSSYLPAEKNKASHINISFLTLPPIFYFIA